jgi:hypothetical protein
MQCPSDYSSLNPSFEDAAGSKAGIGYDLNERTVKLTGDGTWQYVLYRCIRSE